MHTYQQIEAHEGARAHTHKRAAGQTAVEEAAAREEAAAEEEARGGDLGGERGECDSGRESDGRGSLMRCVCYRQGACQVVSKETYIVSKETYIVSKEPYALRMLSPGCLLRV